MISKVTGQVLKNFQQENDTISCVLWSHSCLSVGDALVVRSSCMKCKQPLNQREQSMGSKEGESGGLGQCGFGRCVTEVWGNWVFGFGC